MSVPRPRRLIAYAHERGGPASRFRIEQFLPLLERAGWEVSLRTQRPARPWESPLHGPLRWLHRRARLRLRELRRWHDVRAASAHDVVLLNRDLLGGRGAFEDELFRRNPRVVFDFDDAIYLGAERAAHVAGICARAAWVTAGNERLAEFARRHTDRVSVLPTVVDTDAYPVRTDHGTHGRPLRVGWLGSDRSIQETLVPHLPMLSRLRDALGFELVVISKPRPVLPAAAGAWRFVAWSPAIETRIADLLDVGIMPLVDEPYQRGKCGAKLLQYMAAGLPAVASPVGINIELLGDGRGLLASDAEQWHDVLARLAADADLRRALGAAGRAFVERRYALRAWSPVLEEILAGVAGGEDLSGRPLRPPGA